LEGKETMALPGFWSSRAHESGDEMAWATPSHPEKVFMKAV